MANSMQIDLHGNFDYLRVSILGGKLEYDSYWENKASGLYFVARIQDDEGWRIVFDKTSLPVPGSHILWMHAFHPGKVWDEFEERPPEGNQAIIIPHDKFYQALGRMIRDDLILLDLIPPGFVDRS